jgi:hypothetical protein
MPEFIQKISKSSPDNSFEVCVYEVDSSADGEIKRLEDYLIGKVKKIKIFNQLDEVVSMLKVPDIDDKFAQKFKDNLKEICDPAKHKIAAFDIRRSYVTEFMSQLLLEKKYNCVFYDQADKRLNANAISIGKHSPGIDVIGVQIGSPTIKFIVCEVKASKSDIPCTETEKLLEDIKKSKDLTTNRLAKEILNYVTSLSTDSSDELLSNIAQFLIEILSKKDDENFVLSNIIFFPFLIRNNKDIISNNDLRDFDLFSKEDFANTTVKGLIWSFNNDIETFCDKIWEEALENV